MATMPELKTWSLSGIQLAPGHIGTLHTLIEEAVRAERKFVIGYHNIHSFYLYKRDKRFSRYFTEIVDYPFIDGMGLCFLGRLLGLKIKRQHRLTYVDWIPSLMDLVRDQQMKLFYLGGRPGTAARASRRLNADYGPLKMETHHGYFNAMPNHPENVGVIETINGFAPEILMVGMGMPRQERWLVENVRDLDARAILTCGAAFDYVAGVVRTPPRWMGRIGLEWLARFVDEPVRLWRRVSVEPAAVLKDVLVAKLLS